MEKQFIDIKIDKRAFSIASLTDRPDDKDYWLKKSPIERLRHVEMLRRINYGSLATARLQRVLEIIEG